ncbi:MAG: hypothetical protein IJR46_07915, partial [Neisseriaceae bacterium]|nr:hypothetical protein [Neisseriaceae bacterium]
MKKYFSKRLQTLSGSLKTVRIVFKRLPHSLRSFAMTDFFLSGSLKAIVRIVFKRLPHSLRSFAMTDFFL